MQDFCGSCDRCLRACPTQALEHRECGTRINAISYWTIEAKGPARWRYVKKSAIGFLVATSAKPFAPGMKKLLAKKPCASSSGIPEQDAELKPRFALDIRLFHKCSANFGYFPSRARAQGLKRNAFT